MTTEVTKTKAIQNPQTARPSLNFIGESSGSKDHVSQVQGFNFERQRVALTISYHSTSFIMNKANGSYGTIALTVAIQTRWHVFCVPTQQLVLGQSKSVHVPIVVADVHIGHREQASFKSHDGNIFRQKCP